MLIQSRDTSEEWGTVWTTVQTTAGGPLGTIVSVRVPLRVTIAGGELLVRANSRVSLAVNLGPEGFGVPRATAPVTG